MDFSLLGSDSRRRPVLPSRGRSLRRVQVDQLDLLAEHVDAGNYNRTCLYLTSTSSYLPQPDDRTVLVKARAHS